MTEVLEIGTLAALGAWLVVVAVGTRRVADLWPLWVLPLALTMDNLAFGVASDYSGSLLGHAVEQAASSALLALVGLYAASLLPRVVPALRASGCRGPVRRSRFASRDWRVPIARLIVR